jgi:hypothetical protein
MTKASADADKFEAIERRVHKEPGMLAWLWLASGSCSKLRQSWSAISQIMAIEQSECVNISRRGPALRVQEHPPFEFAFRLEPIIQLTVRVFATFEIDFVCSTSDFLVSRRVP